MDSEHTRYVSFKRALLAWRRFQRIIGSSYNSQPIALNDSGFVGSPSVKGDVLTKRVGNCQTELNGVEADAGIKRVRTTHSGVPQKPLFALSNTLNHEERRHYTFQSILTFY